MNEIEIKVTKKDFALWVGVIDNKIVLRDKDFNKLVMKLKKQFPKKIPIILNPPSCETLAL